MVSRIYTGNESWHDIMEDVKSDLKRKYDQRAAQDAMSGKSERVTIIEIPGGEEDATANDRAVSHSNQQKGFVNMQNENKENTEQQ